MTIREVTLEDVEAALEGLIADFQGQYPGIRRDTASECLLIWSRLVGGPRAVPYPKAAFEDEISEGADRGEPWAIDVRQAVLRKERGKREH